MALGALIVVAVLGVAAVEGTRFLKARASGDQASQVTTSNTNNSIPAAPGNPTADAATQTPIGAANPSSPSGSANTIASGAVGVGNAQTPPTGPVVEPPSLNNLINPGGAVTPVPKKAPKHNSAANMVAGESQNVSSQVGGGAQVNSSQVSGGAGQIGQPAAANSAANAQELQELVDQHDKLSVRAQTANDSVENFRKQMSAGGNNLRPDISASQSRMKMYMTKSEAALNAGDVETAKKYMSLAEREVEKLEAFFGH
jgi:hypothetical protein